MPISDDAHLSSGAAEPPSGLADSGNEALAALQAVLDRAVYLIVYEDPSVDSRVLFSSGDRKDITELKEALILEIPQETWWCMCSGGPAIRLYGRDANGKDDALAVITNHHGRTVRSNLWDGNVQLRDIHKWIKWFDARGIPDPRRQIEEAIAAAEVARKYQERWTSAMPACLRPIWPKILEAEVPFADVLSSDVQPVIGHPNPGKFPPSTTLASPAPRLRFSDLIQDELAKQFPDLATRIRALFSWYGSGAGPWSGHPFYECIVERIVLEFDTPALLSALSTTGLNEQEVEGAARFFAGWEFQLRRPKDNRLIPAELKNLFLDHSVTSSDADKVSRARYAFDPVVRAQHENVPENKDERIGTNFGTVTVTRLIVVSITILLLLGLILGLKLLSQP